MVVSGPRLTTGVGTTFKGMIGDKDIIDFDGPPLGPNRIENCYLDGSMDDGIDFGSGASGSLINNIILNCSDKAFSVEGGSGSELIGNVFAGNCTAVAFKNNSLFENDEAHHNTIVGNIEGLALYDKTGGTNGSTGTVHSCIIQHNKTNVLVDKASTLHLSYSNVEGETVWPGEGNIIEESLFVSEKNYDFRLQEGSPCITAGVGATDMGAFPYDGSTPETFLRGDTNSDSLVDLSDSIFILLYLFGGWSEPDCLDSADANDDGFVMINDAVYILNYLFRNGPSIPHPFPETGVDSTPDDLVCE